MIRIDPAYPTREHRLRVVAYSSAEEPILSATEARVEDAVEYLILRDETGAHADIQAVCCKRCGYTQEFAVILGSHRCTTPERQARLAEQGMATFRAIVERRSAPGDA